MKKILIIFIFISFFVLISCNKYESHSKTFTYFGTSIYIEIYEKENKANELLEYANSFLKDYSYLTDRYYSYEGYTNIKTINESTDELILDKKLFDLIEYSISNEYLIYDENGNSYFDITIGVLSDFYKDYYINDKIENLNDASSISDLSIGINNIILNKEKLSIKLLNGVKLDLGGISKGYAVNELLKYFDSNNVNYVINAGESTIITNYGNPRRENNSFLVGLTNPNYIYSSSDNNIYGILNLEKNMCLTTSGDYQKYFIYDNNIYSSIIDKNTKKPVETDIRSIAILTKSPLEGDILSTELFMMGSDKAYEYLISNNIDGIMFLNDSRIIATPNIKNYITLEDDFSY